MCDGAMVCHGDRFDTPGANYTDEQKKKAAKDTKMSIWYITNDGKYAVDSDFIDLDNLTGDPEVDLKGVPKIELKQAG